MKRTLVALLLASCSVKSPPARYDHPYTGRLEVRHVPRQVAEDICPFSRGATGWGCAFLRTSSCLIILVEGASPEVLQHEIAHCNGWPGDHTP